MISFNTSRGRSDREYIKKVEKGAHFGERSSLVLSERWSTNHLVRNIGSNNTVKPVLNLAEVIRESYLPKKVLKMV